ncbi:adenosylmethionine--8-amino-7-oxononanoate transaminase [Leekyejoonella antrihumi]|uniref:Adenosylmethionine-8-amino-7-oxononanoate aminotransferase n=1 Tax=Leekyejoonella antrihumi TaxID=1660198 RepID=A0A563E649_9MICO|nr:adenosylmethionine--8-amino-7-oxononanoate transaminase [Leekyejoonella antrihumi]TWP37905.1 adenosylmethionine--8-amino-7-oxononanoate transaminase [Leekyejoonella antrihumi]
MHQPLATPQVTDLLDFDRAHVWHPYSSALAPSTTRLVESANGIRLRLRETDGTVREVVDAMSSWWCAVHGYAVPQLDAAARDQLERMSHVMFGGLTNEPAIRLARALTERAPRADGYAPLEQVFLADSGSVSVEVALKLAWQAHAAAGRPRRTMFTIRGGYHGDTLAPMSVCDPLDGMHTLFRGVLPQQVFAPRPPAGLDADTPTYAEWERQVRALYAQHADDVAAVVLEPVLQGAGGMHIYPPQAVALLAALARESGALVIFDEIATGLGRTGTMWAADRCAVVPDIMCTGKALTGGYLTLAAVLCTRAVAEAVSSGSAGALMHGPTFMGNPLACAVACASLDLIGSHTLQRTERMQAELDEALDPARALDCVRDVRTLGAVGVIQLHEPVDVERVIAAALRRGVWVRPFRDLVYAMPPFVSDADDIALIGRAMVEAIQEVHG